jgi:hypothetical protein
MADPITTTTPTGTTLQQAAAGTTTPTTDWDQYQKTLQEAVTKAGTVEGADANPLYPLYKQAKTYGGTTKSTAEAMMTAYEAQKKALQSQADISASALQMMGEATQASIQRLESIQAGVEGEYGATKGTWDEAAEKADEYVQAARARVGETLDTLDSIFKEIQQDRDFAKAHAMQSSVQAVLGSMKTEERNILQNYGADSKEYQQFRMGKQNTLAVAQSNIHAAYQQFQEQQNLTYLNAVNETMWKHNMYTSFQEQQHVEMLKWTAQAKNEYALQKAQFDVGMEQMKLAGMENLANWMIQTPIPMMDAMPWVAMLSDILTSAQATKAAQAVWTTHKLSSGATISGYANSGGWTNA